MKFWKSLLTVEITDKELKLKWELKKSMKGII